MKHLLMTCVSAMTLAAVAAPAFAQTPPATTSEAAPAQQREVVVVTAQKRDEDIQDVPISISAFTAQDLQDAGLTDIRDLRNIAPSLNIASAPQVANTRVEIRGIGTSGNSAIEPSVALFQDGAYIPRTAALLAGLNDIRSIEVLRGPQGTLFGRNASMGALLVNTNEPTQKFGGSVSALVGDYDRLKGTVVLNAPVTDTFAVRFSLLGDTHDGYGHNLYSGKDISYNDMVSGRISTAWDITPDLRWVLRGEYQHTTGDGIPISTVVAETVTPTFEANWRARLDPDGAGPLTGQLPIIDNTYSHTVNQESAGNLDDYQAGVSSNLTWDLSGGWQVKMINAWRDWNNDQYQVSTSGLPITMAQREGFFASESKSHEVQLISPDTLMDGRLSFVAGLYDYEEDFFIGDNRGLNPDYCTVYINNVTPIATRAARVAACLNGPQMPSSYTNFHQNTKSWAAFWQGTFDITDKWDVTAGIRYSSDDKTGLFDQMSLNPTVDSAPTENTALATDDQKVTYRLGTSYQVMPDVMVFATWSTGFKSGGFDSGRNASVVGQARIFAPETTENWEIGTKSEWLDGKLKANATLFRTQVDDYQFRTYDGISFAVRNNGSIQQQGVEFETSYLPVEQLELNLSGTYLDSEYLDFQGAPNWPGLGGAVDLTGERVPASPEWQYAAFARWEDDLPWATGWSWSLRGDVSFVDKQMLSATGDNWIGNMESSRTFFGARLGFRNDKGLQIALAGQNLNNEVGCTARYVQPNAQGLGLLDTVNGGGVLRCVVTQPRTWSLEVSKMF
jgi:iron complex outermembrane recepter protein